MTRQTASGRRLAITVIAFVFSHSLLSASTAHAATAALSAAAAEAAAVDAAAVSAAASTPEFLWFEQHVGSRCFSPPDARWQLDDSTRETLLHRQTQFFGVYEQPEGFYYHYSTLTKQTERSTVQDVKLQATKVSRRALQMLGALVDLRGTCRGVWRTGVGEGGCTSSSSGHRQRHQLIPHHLLRVCQWLLC
jgi:hypothetical protein